MPFTGKDYQNSTLRAQNAQRPDSVMSDAVLDMSMWMIGEVSASAVVGRESPRNKTKDANHGLMAWRHVYLQSLVLSQSAHGP
jgi:hypothetical protein